MVSGWLGKHVEIFDGVTRKTFDRGQVVAYADQPMVLVETKRGEKVWWNVSLSRETACDCLCHEGDHA